MLNATVRESTLQDIKSMTEPEFNERLNVYKELTEIAPDRKKLLFQFIRGALAVSPLAQFDIEQLLLKYLVAPEKFISPLPTPPATSNLSNHFASRPTKTDAKK